MWDHLSQSTFLEMLHPKTYEQLNPSVEVHHLVGKLSTAETLLRCNVKFLVINVCNQGKTLCSSCAFPEAWIETDLSGFKIFTLNCFVFYVISGFRREVAENCALGSHYAASSGNSSPAFRENLSVPSSRVKNPKEFLTPEYGADRLSRNVGNNLPLLVA